VSAFNGLALMIAADATDADVDACGRIVIHAGDRKVQVLYDAVTAKCNVAARWDHAARGDLHRVVC
jgi:hypothetical protein